MTVVLDASAVLALLLSEAGAAKVAGVLAGSQMSAVNYAEVFTHYAKLGSSKADIENVLGALPIVIVPLSGELAKAAGMLRPLTIEAGLSLGDRCCLALAKQCGLPAWTADKQWKIVATAVGVKVVLIR
jgi:PIN domain nuclease of toxin-antitoxin system